MLVPPICFGSLKRRYRQALCLLEFVFIFTFFECGFRINNPRDGIDRIENDRGYETDNVVPCCGRCNKAKGTILLSDFLEMVAKIYKNRIVGMSNLLIERI